MPSDRVGMSAGGRQGGKEMAPSPPSMNSGGGGGHKAGSPPPRRGQLPAAVREKGQGAGLSGLLLWAVELCSFHGVVHKDPLAICGDRDSGRKAEAGSTPSICLLSMSALKMWRFQPLSIKPDTSPAPRTASRQGADTQPPPPAPLGHGDGVSAARPPSPGRSLHLVEQSPLLCPKPSRAHQQD